MNLATKILAWTLVISGAIACDGTLKDTGESQAADGAIQCLSPVKMVAAGETAKLEWSFVNMAATDLAFGPDFESNPSLYFTDTGTVADGTTATEAIYTAPSLISAALSLGISAVAPDDTSGTCRVLLIPSADGSYLYPTSETGPFENPVATSYSLSSAPTSIPDFATLSANGIFPLRRFNKANDANPFAGITSLTQLFALRITGKLVVTKSGTHTFRLTADDKASFWLNGQKLINEASTAATGSTSLSPGEYAIQIDYFQGTGNSRLFLEWQEPGAGFVMIPATSLKY